MLLDEWKKKDLMSSAVILDPEDEKVIDNNDTWVNTATPELNGKLGSDNRRITTLLCVRSNATTRVLVNESRNMLKTERVKIHKKFTQPEHVRKFGYIHGLHVKFANLAKYKEIIEKQCKLRKDWLEIRKERVFENKYSSTCLVACAIDD